MSPPRKLSASLALGGALMLALLSFFQTGGGGSNVTAATAAQETGGAGGQSADRVVAGLGVVEPAAGTVDLAALMPGVLSAISVQEGDAVKRGQVLAELYNEDLKAKLAQAEATLSIKRAALALAEKGSRPQEIRRAEAQLREEESNLDLLQVQYQRRQTLAKQGAVSKEAFNEVATNLAASRQRRQAAAEALAILQAGSRPEELEQARGEVALAQNQLAEAQAALDKSYVRASSDGIVLRRYKEPGEALSTQPAIAVIQIADIDHLVVRTQIDETDIADLRVGQTAQITAAAFGGRVIEGKVERISPRLGAKTVSAESPTEKRDTRVLDVIVSLAPGTELPVNLRVDVKIDIGQRPDTPSDAPAATSNDAPAGPSAGQPAASAGAVPVADLRGFIADNLDLASPMLADLSAVEIPLPAGRAADPLPDAAPASDAVPAARQGQRPSFPTSLAEPRFALVAAAL